MSTYIEIKDQRVVNVICSSNEKFEVPQGWLVVPDGFGGTTGDHLDWYTNEMIRIPDEELIKMGKRYDSRGKWYNKKLIGYVQDIYQLDQDPGEDWTKTPPLDNESFQFWDEDKKNWVVDEKVKSSLSNMTFIEHLDSNEKAKLPCYIYHYTSLKNFLKILNTKTFYLFNSNQMNDYSENYVIIDVLKEVIHKFRDIIPDEYLKKLDYVFNMKFQSNSSFISCFTELRDSISQWRAYGDDGNGICLIINPQTLKFNYSLSLNNMYSYKDLSFHNVIYFRKQQEKIIEEMLNIVLLSTKSSKYRADCFAEYVYTYISRFAPIFKIKEFHEEKEWRIIYETLGIMTADGRSDMKFINTRNNLKSYFPLKVDESDFINSITGIYLGPKSIIPRMEIQALLNSKGFGHVQIFNSNITYR